MLNVEGLTEIGLDVFGGNNLDMQPTDLPQGLSPDNSDCAFLPGSVFTRPSLTRLSTLGTTSQVLYAKTFLKPDSSVSQFEATADGKMYFDGAQVGQTRAGNRFFMHNAFGKAYIAVSDGLHGADVPLQFTPEGYLDRVSQDGPGAPPKLSNQSLPPVALITGSAGAAVTITTATPIDPEQVQQGSGFDAGDGYQPPQFETFYSALQFVTATPHGLTVGEAVTIAGNSLYSIGVVYVTSIVSPTSFTVGYYQQNAAVGAGGTVTPTAPLLVRNNNKVQAFTATPHGLRIGYRATISGVADATQAISSIVINNNLYSGIATVMLSSPHGFVPGDSVALLNVLPVALPGSVGTYSIGPATTQVNMTANHNLSVGDTVIVALGGSGVPVTTQVTSLPSLSSFVFATNGSVSTGSGGSAYIPWLPASGDTFTIVATPTTTTFQIEVTQGDATWTTGSLSFPWNGTFYVSGIPSNTSFIYDQAGPNNSTIAGTGTVTPLGQAAPGAHKCVVIFQTRTGYLTIPSIPVTFTASGSQYVLVSDIPIGPANVIARILAFTGANGGRFFYLPVAPQVNSEIIGTSTVVNDNITTSAVFDFSDEALLNGTAIDIPGNNLFRQVVLGPCLGFFSYASRLFPWGERNKVQQFINMGFEGGYSITNPNAPLGWTYQNGTLTTGGDYGVAFQFSSTGDAGAITQPAYQDQYGVAILQPNTAYTFRLWASGDGTVTATLYSASTGVLATSVMTVNGGFTQGNFNVKTPVAIPPDTVLKISVNTTGTIVDELELIYTANPYLLSARVSYVNNPEAFDGVTGIMGPEADPHPVFGFQERKDVLCLLTSGPEGSLYETQDTASGEPVTWEVRHIASKCGLTSVWGIAKFEDWFSWISDTGMRIFDGSTVEKMSQEIQPWWNNINHGAKQFSVLANDPYTRRMYVGTPQGTATVVDATYVMDYRDLNTAGTLANAGTLRVGYTGKVVTTDLTRKWSPWSMTMNYFGLLTLSTGEAVMAFCGGTGVALSDAAHSAVYELLEGQISGIDADYGPFWEKSTYPTYFFVGVDEAQQRQTGSHRLLHAFLTMNCTGVGSVFVVPNLDRIGNTGRPTRALAVTESLARDLEFGLNVSAERISYRICCQPAGPQPADPTSPAGFRLSSLTLGVKTDPYAPIRGRNS